VGLQEQISDVRARTSLCELAAKHGTDKLPWYTPFYDALLCGREVKTVLEIGVKDGASIKMWQEFFPEAKVYGLDIAPNVYGENVFVGDQGNIDTLKYVGLKAGPFDLVIDDGSHDPFHQTLGWFTLRDKMNAGGLYIIEDINLPIDQRLLNFSVPFQYVECRVPGSDKVGRCVVIQS